MTRLELARQVALDLGFPLAKSSQSIHCFSEVIREALIQGNRVEIRGFGVFEIRNHNKRVSRNPKDGKPLIVPGGSLPRFKATGALERHLTPQIDS